MDSLQSRVAHPLGHHQAPVLRLIQAEDVSCVFNLDVTQGPARPQTFV